MTIYAANSKGRSEAVLLEGFTLKAAEKQTGKHKKSHSTLNHRSKSTFSIVIRYERSLRDCTVLGNPRGSRYSTTVDYGGGGGSVQI